MVMTVLALRKIHPVKAIPYGESVTRVMLALGDCRPSTWHLARKINSKSFLRLSYEIHCRHADFTNDSTNNFFSFFFAKFCNFEKNKNRKITQLVDARPSKKQIRGVTQTDNNPIKNRSVNKRIDAEYEMRN